MPTAEFRVGLEEKHAVRIEVSMVGGRVRVVVDGKEIPSAEITSYAFPVGFNWPAMRFAVGLGERHFVDLKITGGMAPIIELYVDGVQKQPI